MLADLLVDTLATHRLVRLAQRDTLPPLPDVRDALNERLGDHPAGELLTCPWCASIHVAAGVGLLRALAPRFWRPVARLLAISSVVGLISEREL